MPAHMGVRNDERITVCIFKKKIKNNKKNLKESLSSLSLSLHLYVPFYAQTLNNVLKATPRAKQ